MLLSRFNSRPPVASVIIGCKQLTPLEQNVQAALNFTPISDSGKQKLQEKVAPSRSAWENFLRAHEDSVVVVLVPGEWTVQQGHDLLEEMEREVRTAIPGATVFTHLEPIGDPAAWQDQTLDRIENTPRGERR